MASKSLADLISIVRFRGDFRNTVRFPDANLTTEIQAAWGELYELIADTNEGYWDTITTLRTPGFDFLPLSSDAWRIRKVSSVDGTRFITMSQIGIGEVDAFAADDTGRPIAYRLSARGIELYPTPDQDYDIRIVYTPIAPTLSAAREWYNGWEEYVVYGALIRLALNEERSAGDWQAQLEMARQRIVRGASQRKAQEPEYLVLRDDWDGELSRDERWR